MAIPHHAMLSLASVPAISMAITVIVAESLGRSPILPMTVCMMDRLRSDALCATLVKDVSAPLI